MSAMADLSEVRRIDLELVSRSLAPSRERAQALVAAGLVEIDGARATSADQRVRSATVIRVLGRDHPWASRGGLKLAPALDAFGISCEGRICLDAGASTGGFTDVLLSRGAALVYAVDVGRGQLDPRLATDPRVRVMDRTNLRLLDALPGEPPDMVTLDLSFISLRLVMPAVVRLIAPDGADLVALFKPQFELGRDAIGKGGIVRDTAAAERAAGDFATWLGSAFGATSQIPIPSPVRGAKGNLEWLVGARLVHGAASVLDADAP
jgi:23S rRNA (cytidine1920-2'-O)/16S rRNA (cytidine1409-2'-O)-methyltransferase